MVDLLRVGFYYQRIHATGEERRKKNSVCTCSTGPLLSR